MAEGNVQNQSFKQIAHTLIAIIESQTKFYKNEMTEHSLPEWILKLNFTKRDDSTLVARMNSQTKFYKRIGSTLIARMKYQTKFYKNELATHSLPEWNLKLNFTKMKWQNTHCQSEFSN